MLGLRSYSVGMAAEDDVSTWCSFLNISLSVWDPVIPDFAIV